MSHLETKKATQDVTPQLRGETIAYAVQNGVYNLGANFFEPYINYRTQKYYSHSTPSHPHAHGNYTQNLAGEFAGDLIGSATLILAEALIPQQLHACSRTVRSWIDPLYASIAPIALAKQRAEPDYQQQVDQWKVFQERNLIRSTIMATASIAGNIATQKTFIGNPSPASVIFKGKLLSTALTTSLGLGTRLAFPTYTKRMDKWMAEHFFTPMMENEGRAV